MTNQQIAKEVLYSYMDVEKDLSQPQILIHTLKQLRKLISGTNENVDWQDELNVMYVNGWDDALKQIDAVCDELERLGFYLHWGQQQLKPEKMYCIIH